MNSPIAGIFVDHVTRPGLQLPPGRLPAAVAVPPDRPCDTITAIMGDREIILGLLRAVAGRMRLARALQEIGFAACIVLFALAAFQLIKPRLTGLLDGLDQPVLIAGLCAVCAYILYQALKRVPMSQAAALADSRLPLNDELKSAYWFASHTD